jgi:hypothetical protein
MFLWDFLHCKAVYENIIYIYKYTTDFVNLGIKLVKRETKDTANRHTENQSEHAELYFP